MITTELSIILPTYNEQENIDILIPEIEETFKGVEFEVIVVDDSSPDRTADHVLALNKLYGNIKLITRPKKEGIGAALVEGYNYARGKIILSSDSDLSFSVKDMKTLFERVKEGNDLVVGCRHAIKGSSYEMKGWLVVIKGLLSKSGNYVLSFLSGMNIHDFSANFRAIRKDCWERLKIEEKTNVMLLEMIIKAGHMGMRIAEVPVSFKDRLYGASKLNMFIEIPKAMVRSIHYIIVYRQRSA